MERRRYPVAVGIACAWMLGALNTALAQERILAEAYSGAPFGVGRVTISSGGPIRLRQIPRPGGGRIADLARRIASQAGQGDTVQLESAEMTLVEKTNRVFYPVFEKRDRPILRQFISVPSESTIFFLFQGDAPLDLAVYAPEPRRGQIAPRNDPAAHAALLQACGGAITRRPKTGATPPATIRRWSRNT
jgi:hypothetical protein